MYLLSKDKSGDIDFNEFTELMLSSTDKKDTKEDILHVFHLFDQDGNGKITLDNLRRVADELGENISDDELRNMIKRADTDEDEAISKDEFLAIMLRAME
jgi:centrin-2/centrin-1